ncbi:hypothetical protein [Paragemmobacter aquarius]|nr:hypothetical protein [Gemmobacter aquarius]
MKRTAVVDAVAELVNAGWLERGGGNAPGRRAVYRFKSGEQCRDGGSEQCRDGGSEQCRQNEQSMPQARHCEEIPPAPPYKDQPNMNQRPAPRFATKIIVPNAGRPTQVCQVVEPGGDAAAAWDAWLRANGFAGVEAIGRRIKSGQLEGWDFPTRWPPSASDETGTRIAKRFAEWLRAIA